MTASSVRVEDRDGVRVVTLDRPHVLHAIDVATQEELIATLLDADRDPGVRAVVLTGSGDRAFCAGADLRARSRGEALVPASRPRGVAGLVVGVPLIAAVNGLAHGLGAELVLLADLAVMAEGAHLAFPEVGRGLVAAGGGAVRLPSIVPPKVALRWLLTGQHISAAEALRWGLVSEVAPAGETLSAAVALARTIAQQAPLAVRATKRIATGTLQGSTRPWEDIAWALADAEVARNASTDDAREGAAAFVEKRRPRWTGR